MANLDRERILKYETEIREAQTVLSEITSKDIDAFLRNHMIVRAMKYTLIVLVGAICSICSHILAKKSHIIIEEYIEAIIKMRDNGFLSDKISSKLIPLIKLRHQLIHGYWKTDDRRLFIETKESLTTLDEFISEIHHIISSHQ